jgi:hypothetical protein
MPNNVGIVSFHLFGVWWRLSKGIVNFVNMISFLININQWLKRSNVNKSEVSSHKATSSPESPSNVSPAYDFHITPSTYFFTNEW